MELSASWVYLLGISTISVISLCFTNYVSKKVSAIESEATPQIQGIVALEVSAQPSYPNLLSAILGNGVHGILIFFMFFVVISPLKTEFDLPRYDSVAIQAIAILYLLLGFFAGYIGAFIRKNMQTDDDAATSREWIKVPLMTTLLSFVSFFVIRSEIAYNVIFISKEDVELMSLWLCISTPLGLLGGYFGSQVKLTRGPVLIRIATKSIRVEGYLSWFVVLVAIFLASMAGVFEIAYILVTTLNNGYLTFSWISLILIATLILSASYAWIVIMRMMFLSEKRMMFSSDNCLWKTFFIYGVPSGLYMFLKIADPILRSFGSLSLISFGRELVASLITSLMCMVFYGTIGVIYLVRPS